MSFSSRLWRLARANANDMVSRAEDPAKVLDQVMTDMEKEMVKLRQAVALSVTSQRRLEQRASQARHQADYWYERAQVALRGGDEQLAQAALTRSTNFEETVRSLSAQLESQRARAESLQHTLMKLEGKVAQAKVKKNTLKARAQAAQAQKQVAGSLNGTTMGSPFEHLDDAMATFDRMEEKVDSLEAEGAVWSELAGDDLEARFKALEGRDRLEDLKASMGYSSGSEANGGNKSLG